MGKVYEKSELNVGASEAERFDRRALGLTLFCAAVAFKYAYNYYAYLAPPLSPVFNLIYQVVTLALLALYVPMACQVAPRLRKREYRPLWPALVVPWCVLFNVACAAIDAGDLSVFSKSYEMAAAYGTNDYRGFYFSQINMWFGNMAATLWLALNVRTKKDVVVCAIVSMAVLVLPTAAIAALHPSTLGNRAAPPGADADAFAGGLWNIGVVGFGSFAWLAAALCDDATKRQKRLLLYFAAFFLFIGLASISRTLVLMATLSVGFYILTARKNSSWLWKAGGFFAFALGFIALNERIVETIFARFTDDTAGTNNVRIQLWKAYLSHFREYWLFGAPLGSVYRYFGDVSYHGSNFLPHSAPINFFLRFGVAALVSYLFLIKNAFLSVKKSVETKNIRICLTSGCVAYVILAFINQTGYAEPIFYVMFGLLLAYARIVNGEVARK